MIGYKLEAQDVANSGWDYSSASSKLALSFWVKSSVAQNFNIYIKTEDGTSQNYVIETGSLSANTWTKITKIIPGGEPNLQFDNNNNSGLELWFGLFYGTDRSGTRPLNAWAAYDSATRVPDMTSTWWTTNDATFAITGVQLEVGDTATEFEHRSYGEELARCQRYYHEMCRGVSNTVGMAQYYSDTKWRVPVTFPVTMRHDVTLSISNGTNHFLGHTTAGSVYVDTFPDFHNPNSRNTGTLGNNSVPNNSLAGTPSYIKTNHADAFIAFSAEL